MALNTTTLSSAVTVNDRSIKVASATGVVVGKVIKVNGEVMKVAVGYDGTSTTVPVLRGQDGTATAAHQTTSNVVFELPSDAANPVPQSVAQWLNQKALSIISITTTPSTLTLPSPGSDLTVILNGTAAIALTIPVPTTDLDGSELTIVSNGAAAHTLTFTGGLSGAGASYDVITINATAPAAFKFIAANALWMAVCGPAMGGTVTNIIGSVA